uniref:Clan AA aspartic protease, AF_0612 family n=1 Tax=Candidatus Kentrum sp. DK TaxID=2126562 RepID=A0A450T6D9_9GAMM|nr:MAG: hypothetical protein BECKDK2373C_GA0170839_10966 [Candidatus Kentron sp. DK]
MVQLGLEEFEKREVTTADGKRRPVPYVGPIQVKFENRTCFTGALVLGDGVLLGAVPVEDMDLVVSARMQQVTVNPQSQNIFPPRSSSWPFSATRFGRKSAKILFDPACAGTRSLGDINGDDPILPL